MDDGIIASRYAKALLKYVLETGNGARVSAQAKRLEQVLGESQELRLALDSPTDVTAAQKRSLLRAALGDAPMAEELRKLSEEQIEKNGKEEQSHEQLFRGRGRTGRENEPGRR